MLCKGIAEHCTLWLRHAAGAYEKAHAACYGVDSQRELYPSLNMLRCDDDCESRCAADAVLKLKVMTVLGATLGNI